MSDFVLFEDDPTPGNASSQSKMKNISMFPYAPPSRYRLSIAGRRRSKKNIDLSVSQLKQNKKSQKVNKKDEWVDIPTQLRFTKTIYEFLRKTFLINSSVIFYCLRIIGPLCPILFLGFLISLCLHLVYSALRYPVETFHTIVSVGTAATTFNISSHVPSFDSIRCSLSLGPCPTIPPLQQITKLATDHSYQTGDLFQSFVALSDPQNMGLHSVDMWEHGVAIKGAGKDSEYERIGQDLIVFGDALKEAKNRLIEINSIGINSFGWISQEYHRIELVIDYIHERSLEPPPFIFRLLYSFPFIQRPPDPHLPSLNHNVALMFEAVNKSLTALVNEIDNAVPVIISVSDMGQRLGERIGTKKGQLKDERELGDKWWKFKSEQWRRINNDFLTFKNALHDIVATLNRLERIRSLLLAHAKNTENFKSGLVSFHQTDHLLPTKAERELLRQSMVKFEDALRMVKNSKRADDREIDVHA